jgi:AbrB family looped-hinge helix DNA binding protein
MDQKDDYQSCSMPSLGTCCRVEALISIDDRGQMILPKDIREKAGILAGDKLAVIGMEQHGKLNCIALVKAEVLTEMAKSTLGPIMKEVFQK